MATSLRTFFGGTHRLSRSDTLDAVERATREREVRDDLEMRTPSSFIPPPSQLEVMEAGPSTGPATAGNGNLLPAPLTANTTTPATEDRQARRSRFRRRLNNTDSSTAQADAPDAEPRGGIFSALQQHLHNLRSQQDDDLVRTMHRLRMAGAAREFEEQAGIGGGMGMSYTQRQALARGLAAGQKELTRRRKEEASALIGPSLAHYFGSGSSSSGAVVGTSILPPPPPSATAAAGVTSPTEEQPESGEAAATATSAALPAETPGPFGPSTAPTARRARLGSRGRARGASLSGLANLYGSEHWTDAESDPNRLDRGASPEPMSPGEGPGSSRNPLAASQMDRLDSMAEAVAMAEGIDIEVLREWIEKSLDESGGAVTVEGGEGESPTEQAPHASSYCTTLQSYVNLKRNTIALMSKQSQVGVVAEPSMDPASAALQQEGGGLTEDATSHPLSGASALPLHMIQESSSSRDSLRPARSLSTMPTFGNPSAISGRSALGETTHQLHFEYDCSSPSAHVQIFLRASRKHGSWASWIHKREGDGQDIQGDGDSEALYFKKGPAPHVLGWPVHSTKIQKGFAKPVKASLSLKLGLYAPPPVSSATKLAGQEQAGVQTQSQQVNEAEGGETGDLALGATLTRFDTAASLGPPVPSMPPAATVAPPPQVARVIDPPGVDLETKEQRQAREKQERETLKLAIVVEALDENGRPYAEPNLQTTYLRLTSLPIKSTAVVGQTDETFVIGNDDEASHPLSPSTGRASTPSTTTAPMPARLWTAHVEGQEAEIGPHRFQLQELYGLSTRPPPVQVAPPVTSVDEDGTVEVEAPLLDLTGATGTDSLGSECLICLSSPTNTLLLPCTHGLCLDCSIQLKDSVKAQRDAERKRGKIPKKKYTCPMCRRGFTSMLHLKKAEATEGGGAAATVEEVTNVMA